MDRIIYQQGQIVLSMYDTYLFIYFKNKFTYVLWYFDQIIKAPLKKSHAEVEIYLVFSDFLINNANSKIHACDLCATSARHAYSWATFNEALQRWKTFCQVDSFLSFLGSTEHRRAARSQKSCGSAQLYKIAEGVLTIWGG